MKIRITEENQSDAWYKKHMGETFDVLDYSYEKNETLRVADPKSRAIYRVDPEYCEIVHAPRCPHCGGVLEDK